MAAGAASATPSAPKAPAQASVSLEYKMPAGRALTYQTNQEEAQVMDVMGQTMDTHTTTTATFSFKSKGLKDKNLLLASTVDDMAMEIGSSMQGNMSPDVSSIKGKSFDMVLSPLGEEVDVTGAEALTFSVEGETRNLANGFKVFFPDLPGKPVKIGDSWPATSSIEEKMTSMTIRIEGQYVHTLEGFETVDGMECAKISSQVTGTINGSGSQMGQDMAFAGTSKGKDTWYFAVKEGIFVKALSESTSEVSIDVPAAGVTIPMTMTSKSEVKLAGKG
jgi:hypothetical protein